MKRLDSQAELLAARYYAYKLFHVIFAAQPAEPVLEAVVSDGTTAAINALAAGGYKVDALAAAVEGLRQRMAEEPDLVDRLATAYSALFVVPGEQSVKLYESVYAVKMNTLFGPTTASMRRYLREAGMAAESEGNFPEDYLPLMLDFMAALAERSWEAATAEEDDGATGLAGDDAPADASAGDAASADMSVPADNDAALSGADDVDAALVSGLRVQQAFVDEHLGSWLSSVAEALDEKDPTGIYATFAQSLTQFTTSDTQWLTEALTVF